MNKKDYLTVKELADTLHVSRIAIFNKIKNSQIKAEKIGRNYIIYKKDLGGVIPGELTDKLKKEVEQGVERVVKEYGDVLKQLGKE